MGIDERVDAGQKIYTPWILTVYDVFVLGFSNRFLWRCPTRLLEDMYQRNVSGRHVDIGVGTGYFLDKVRWPVEEPEILLLDLNPNSLEAAASRIGRYSPRTKVANVLEPLNIDERFSSAGLCYLLHCLPGSMSEKAVVFDHVQAILAPGARVFGATILQGDAPRSGPAQALMNFYNRKGIFSNARDTADALRSELETRFADVRIERHGAVAIFEAQQPN